MSSRGRYSDGEVEVPPWIPLKDRPPPEDPPYELPLNPYPLPLPEEGDEPEPVRKPPRWRRRRGWKRKT